jgi:outer membrane protein assembly factor BamE
MIPAPARSPRFLSSACLALLVAVLASGCVYRPNIQQGNLLTLEDTSKVEVGMTRSQVRYLLGTPMVSDPFAPHRWDYVYRMKYGRDRRVDTAHFIVFFDGDKVTRVEQPDPPEPPRPTKFDKKKQKKLAEQEAAAKEAAAAASRAAPPLPPDEAPPPGTPQPAGN